MDIEYGSLFRLARGNSAGGAFLCNEDEGVESQDDMFERGHNSAIRQQQQVDRSINDGVDRHHSFEQHGMMLDAQVWGEDAYEEEHSAGGNLQPWSTSWALKSQGTVPAASASRLKAKRPVSAGRQSPTGPPTNLASRVADRQSKVQEGAEEDEAVKQGKYRLHMDDQFPGDPPADEDKHHFFISTKIECPPRRDQKQRPAAGLRAGAVDACTGTVCAAPNLQLHKDEDGDRPTDGHGQGSSHMDMAIEATGIMQLAVPDSQTQPRAPKERARKPMHVTSNNESISGPQLEHADICPYVMHGHDHHVSQTWLQQAQDRRVRVKEADRERETARQSTSALTDRYAAGQEKKGYELLPSVPASIFVQTVVLERLEEKDRQRAREKERGAMIEGTAIAIESPAPAARLERKESRLRAMLREVKDSKPNLFVVRSATPPPAPSQQLRTPGPDNVEWTSSQPSRDKGNSPLAQVLDNHDEGVTAQKLREEYNEILQQQRIGAPDHALGILALAQGAERVPQDASTSVRAAMEGKTKAAPAISVTLTKRGVLERRGQATPTPGGRDPFCLVRLEEQRKKRMDASKREARDDGARADRASVPSSSRFVTTRPRTHTPPRSLLKGQAVGRQPLSGAPAGKGQSGTTKTKPEANLQSPGDEFNAAHLHQQQQEQAGGSPLRVGKMSMSVKMQDLDAESGNQEQVPVAVASCGMGTPVRASLGLSASGAIEETKVGKEEVLVGKLPSPLPGPERCKKGPTDEDLDKETTRFLIKTETERARQEREQEAVDMRRLNAAQLGDSQKVLDEAILHGVSGRAKPALPKAALGASLKKERTYLGQHKERSISIDLTKLQGQMQYLRDHRITQAYLQYEHQLATASEAYGQEDHTPLALPSDTPMPSLQAETSTSQADTTTKHRKGPRVGTVRRVSRPSSAASSASRLATTTRSAVRPRSAIARAVSDLAAATNTWHKPQNRPASAPHKREPAHDSPATSLGAVHAAAVSESQDIVRRRRWSAEAADDCAAVPWPCPAQDLSVIRRSTDSHPAGLESLSMHSLISESSSGTQRPGCAAVPSPAIRVSKNQLVAYSSEQCDAKRRVQAHIVSAGAVWNSRVRCRSRLLEIQSIETRRHDITKSLFDTNLNVRKLAGGRAGRLPMPTDASPPHRTQLASIESAWLQSWPRPNADARFISLQPVAQDDWAEDAAAQGLPVSPAQEARHTAKGDAGDGQHFEYNRVLSSHGTGARHPRPRDSLISSSMVETIEAAEVHTEKDSVEYGEGEGAAQVRSRSANSSPMPKIARSSSPIQRSMKLALHGRQGEPGGGAVEQERPCPRQSQEALVQILTGWPDEALEPDGEESESEQTVSETDQAENKSQDETHVVYRSMYGMVTGKQRTQQEQRLTIRRTCRSIKPHQTEQPMQQLLGQHDMQAKQGEDTDEVTTTVYCDLEPLRTWDGLHTSCCHGCVHAQSNQPEGPLPHAVVHTLDMAKTKGPMHKSADGCSTRLLMVLLLNLNDGDADLEITANKERPASQADSWYGSRYWGSLVDAGFDVKDARFASVLRGRTAQKVSWAIIDPQDRRYIDSHKVDHEAIYAATGLEQDLALRVAKRKEIEAAMARGLELSDTSIFYITVTGVMRACDFAVLTRTIFRNDMPNIKLQRFISDSASHNDAVFGRIKAVLDSSQMRLRFGQHGISVRKFDKPNSSHADDKEQELRERVYNALFVPLLAKVEKGLTAVKKRWDFREKDLRKQLILKEVSESSVSDDQPPAETQQQLWSIWSSFVAINSSDSQHKRMRFEHFYMLLFFMGLVASPDFDNSLGFSEKRMLYSSSDVEVDWDKVYPFKGRAAAQMDFAGFLQFLKFTQRRLKLTLAEIIEYPTTQTHKRQTALDLASPMPAADHADDAARVALTALLPDGRLTTQSERTHPLWLGACSATRPAPAEKTGYCIAPLAMEQDFMCLELHGFHGIARSTDVTRALSMNPPPPAPVPAHRSGGRVGADPGAQQPAADRPAAHGRLAASGAEQRAALLLPRSASDGSAQAPARLGSDEAPPSSLASSTRLGFVRRLSSGEKVEGPVWEQPGGTWSDKDDNTVRMLRMKKHLEFFGSGVPQEDVSKCVPVLSEVLGPGRVFFRRSFVRGTRAHREREIEQHAAAKIQARWRGMRVRQRKRRNGGVLMRDAFAP